MDINNGSLSNLPIGDKVGMVSSYFKSIENFETYRDGIYYSNNLRYAEEQGEDYVELRFIDREIELIFIQKGYLMNFMKLIEDYEGDLDSLIKFDIQNLRIDFERKIDFLRTKYFMMITTLQVNSNQQGITNKGVMSLLYYVGFFDLNKVNNMKQEERERLVSCITGRNKSSISNFIKIIRSDGGSDKYIGQSTEKETLKDEGEKTFKELVINNLKS